MAQNSSVSNRKKHRKLFVMSHIDWKVISYDFLGILFSSAWQAVHFSLIPKTAKVCTNHGDPSATG